MISKLTPQHAATLNLEFSVYIKSETKASGFSLRTIFKQTAYNKSETKPLRFTLRTVFKQTAICNYPLWMLTGYSVWVVSQQDCVSFHQRFLPQKMRELILNFHCFIIAKPSTPFFLFVLLWCTCAKINTSLLEITFSNSEDGNNLLTSLFSCLIKLFGSFGVV